MRIPTVAFGVIVLIGAGTTVDAQHVKDPPWNPEHINHLPAEVRNAVLAMCAREFATYFHDQINLHFEHFRCEGAKASFCNGSQCLHQVYKLTAGHYRLARSFYGSGND